LRRNPADRPAAASRSSNRGTKLARIAGFAIGIAGPLLAMAGPAAAQGIQLLRDTETERLLKSYEDPIAKADGLDPAAVKIYLIDDPTVNSFVAEGQNVFIQTGMILYCKTPNELVGVIAHENGHIKGGHLSRDTTAMEKAEIPMILGMIAGIAAMAAGAGEAGMGVLMAGQQVAEAQFMQFSRVQEATADQIGVASLNATHQSPMGMLHLFERFANEEAMSAYQMPRFALDHPASRDRVALLQALVDASPYRDVKDSPEAMHAFLMVQAKLAGYILPPKEALDRYPETDKSEPARYARAMAYFHMPNLPKALNEINGLIKDEPNNPYFYEVLGQLYVDMSKPELGIPAYQKSVDLLPDASQLRVGLAAAQIATENPALAKSALGNLKVALRYENDDAFAWYESAQAYSDLNNQPMADLSTAEQYYAVGAFPQAAKFASRAQRGLQQGSPDWVRANDIMAVAATPAARQQE
jgi:predicted Zn-dependent protease